MNKEQLYEAIEAYLEGKLSEEARRDFEREMAVDPQLKAEVALHRRMQQELGKSGKAALREQLQQIAQEFPLERKNRPRVVSLLIPLSGALAAAILAGIIWWAWPRFAGSSWQQEPALVVDSIPGGQSALPDSLIAAQPEESAPEEAAPPLKKEQPSVVQPPADPFRPNPKLEGLIAAKSSDANLLISADADAAPTSSENFRAIVAGTLRSGSVIEGSGRIVLQIYDNQPASFQKGSPEASLPLELQRRDDEDIHAFGGMKNYTFEKEVEKELPPGLYYYVIKREGEDTPLFVGKVQVGGKD